MLHPAAIAGLAYVGGTLGSLVGADLANLGKVRRLGAPVAFIGGAGTFAGVFLAGIIAVLRTLRHLGNPLKTGDGSCDPVAAAGTRTVLSVT